MQNPISKAAAAVVVGAAACSTPSAQSGATPSEATGCRALSDGQFHAGPCTGLHVRGALVGGLFEAEGSTIEGEGTFGATDGHPGWLELATGEFVGQETARAPQPPYVTGRQTNAGFVPDGREVVQR